jgi:hypothetical protein
VNDIQKVVLRSSCGRFKVLSQHFTVGFVECHVKPRPDNQTRDFPDTRQSFDNSRATKNCFRVRNRIYD